MSIIPPKDNVDNLFKFNDISYEPLDFVNIIERGGTSMSEIKSTIIGMEFQSDYLKSCDTYVIGYSSNEFQILRSNCVYGGIRELSASISVLSNFYNIWAYIKPTIEDNVLLNSIIKGRYIEQDSNLSFVLKSLFPEAEFNLLAYVKSISTTHVNISSYVNAFQIDFSNLHLSLKGWSLLNKYNLLSYIKCVQLSTYNLSAFIKSTEQSELDLSFDISKIWQVSASDLYSTLSGWDLVNLNANIKAFSFIDLSINIKATYLALLSVFIQPIPPVDLNVYLRSWNVINLNSSLISVSYLNDLLFSIYAIPFVNLNIFIKTMKGIKNFRDLPATISSFRQSDLNCYINSNSGINLSAILIAQCYTSNLQAVIYPKVVYSKTIINISYLENRDLKATINFPCYNSSYLNLNSSLYSMNSSNLIFSVFGTDGSNIKNLPISINTYQFMVQDKINIKYFNAPERNTTVNIVYDNKQTEFYVVDTLNIKKVFNNILVGACNLNMSIIGDFMTKDLLFKITPYSNHSYTESNIKNNVIVLKLQDNIEEWRKYVDLTFNNYVKSYYYFGGNKKVYREFRDEHWEVRVEGYSLLNLPKGVDKTKLLTKYVFNLKNYDSIDAAVRDMVDRVTMYRQKDIICNINSITPPSADLLINIKVRNILKSNRGLSCSIVGST